MNLEDIKRFALYQKEHWLEHKGVIAQYDYVDKKLVLSDGSEFTVSPQAEHQLFSNRIKILGTVNNFEDDPEFIQKAIERKIDRETKTDTFLIYDEKNQNIKGVVSDRYKRIFNNDVIARIPDNYMTQFDRQHSFINDVKMSVKLTNSDSINKQEIKAAGYQVGDMVALGLGVGNSEVGEGSLWVEQVALRLVCTNLMIRPAGAINVERVVHKGFGIMEKFNYAMSEAAQKSEIMPILNRAINRPAIYDVEDEYDIPNVLRRVHIGKEHDEGIINAYGIEPLGRSNEGINGWGVYSAVTRYNSNIYPNTDHYSPLESISILNSAYPLLTM